MADSLPRRALRVALRSAGHAYPLYSGLGTIANSGPWRRAMAGAPAEVEARIRGTRARLVVPTDDFIGAAVYGLGDLDPKVTWIVRHVLRRDDIAVDVGANIGLVTMVMAQAVGPGAASRRSSPSHASPRWPGDRQRATATATSPSTRWRSVGTIAT